MADIPFYRGSLAKELDKKGADQLDDAQLQQLLGEEEDVERAEIVLAELQRRQLSLREEAARAALNSQSDSVRAYAEAALQNLGIDPHAPAQTLYFKVPDPHTATEPYKPEE